MAQPLRFGEIGLTPPEGLFGALTITDVLDAGDEPCRPSPLIGERRARHGGVEFCTVFPHDPDFETRDSLATVELCQERRPPILARLRQGNPAPDDLLGSPADEALEGRVAALDGLVRADEQDADGRG